MPQSDDEVVFIPHDGPRRASKPRRRQFAQGLVVFLIITLGFAIAGLVSASFRQPLPPDHIHWTGSMAQALTTAQQTGKPIFIDFTQRDCPPCLEMKRTVFPDAKVSDYLNQHYVPLRADLTYDHPETMALARQFGIWATPTLIILDSQGRELDRATRMMPAEELTTWLEKIATDEHR
ncbi:MAG: thioredoxin family protein [Phycisphaeraceae bacterium]